MVVVYLFFIFFVELLEIVVLQLCGSRMDGSFHVVIFKPLYHHLEKIFGSKWKNRKLLLHELNPASVFSISHSLLSTSSLMFLYTLLLY